MSPKEFIQAKLAEPDRESKFGFHFIQMFNSNKYEFFLRYIRGWEVSEPHTALLFGGTIHTAREWFYRHGAQTPEFLSSTIEVFIAIHNSKRDRYPGEKKHAEDMHRGVLMLQTWIETWHESDLENYEILFVEPTWDIKLQNNFPMTIKLDDVRKSKKSGYVLIGEAKTTSWSIDQMARTVFEKDQRTQYVLGLKRARPELAESPVAVLPDIMYSKGRQSSASRPGIFENTDVELALYELQLLGLFQDLDERLDKMNQGVHPAILFPRNGDMTSLFGSPYSEISRELAYDLSHDQIPSGFRLDSRVSSGLIKEFQELWKTCPVPWAKEIKS